MVGPVGRAHEDRAHALRPVELLEAEGVAVERRGRIGVPDEEHGVVQASDGHRRQRSSRQADFQSHPLAAFRPMLM